MITKIMNWIKPAVKFYDKDGNEVRYLQYFKKQQMITVQTENGIEKIPVSGLDKK